MEALTRLRRDTQGLTSVEYILLAALIAIVGFAAWAGFGETVRGKVSGADRTVASLDTGSTASLNPGSSAVGGLGGANVQGAAGARRAGVTYGASGLGGDSASAGSGEATAAGEPSEGASRGVGASSAGRASEDTPSSSGGVVGFGRGVWNGAKGAVGETAGSVWEAVSDPVGTAAAARDAAVTVVRDPKGTAQRAWTATKQAASEAYAACAGRTATAESCGQVVGEVATNTAMSVSAVGALGRGARVVKIAGRGRKRRAPDDADSAAANRAEFERYRRERRAAQRRDDLLQNVENERLRDLIGGEHGLYRENARVGSGSTADAVRHERRTGERVGDADHQQKARDGIRAMDRWLQDNPSASPWIERSPTKSAMTWQMRSTASPCS